jgi:GT2 family glycosyltransferase
MKASVVIPVWNGLRHLDSGLAALLCQDYPEFEVIAVDNASGDGSADFIAQQYPSVRLFKNSHNLGFSGGCNVGLRAAGGDILVLLNQDVVVRPDWLSALMQSFTDRTVGAAGSKLLQPDRRTLSHAGAYLEWPLALGKHVGADEVDAGQYEIPADMEYVTGASLAVRREVLDKVGLLDELLFPAFYEDVDLCWRVRKAGWRVRYVPQSVAVHDEASSTRHHWPSRHYYHYRNRLLFLFKHFSPTQILSEFVPAEEARILSLPPEELRAAKLALTEVSTLLPGVSKAWADPASADHWADLFPALREMYELVVFRQQGRPALINPRPRVEGEHLPAVDGLGVQQPELISELEALWEVKEQPFRSQLPVLGRWVAGFRNAWNSISTKWYVRPLLSQQVKFNAAVLRLVRDLHTQHWDDDALIALLAQRCGALTARVVQLEERLARLETHSGEKDHHD